MKKTTKAKQKTAIQQRGTYTETQRLIARRYYLMGLTLPEVSKLMDGVPIRTLEKWQAREQWTALKEVTPIKQRVLELHRGGHSYNEIAETLKINRVTVWRWLKQAKESNTPK